MRRRAAILAFVVAVILAGPAYAVLPDEVLSNPALEARARDLSHELRCMVCQNQSIDESNADLARDLRILVRDRLKAGDTNEQVIDYVVARYGEFVLLKPRFNWRNALLWATPIVVIGAGMLMLVFSTRSRRRSDAPLNADEQAALDRILRSDP